MCSQLPHPSPSVATSTGSSTICWNSSGQVHFWLFLGGEIDQTCYIFIGDFVDRGYHSVETFELLLCLKVKHPDRITLLRGNHESRYNFFHLGKSLQFMASTMKSTESTETPIHGSTALKFLTTSLWGR